MTGTDYFSSLYLHIPFCKSKCHFCNAATKVINPNSNSAIDDYCKALKYEMENKKSAFDNISSLSTSSLSLPSGDADVYFGGGTPSLLEPRHFIELIAAAEMNFGVVPGKNIISLELMPDAFSSQYFKDLADTSINRLSIAAQTFNDDILKRLKRKYTAKDSTNCFIKASNGRFVDVMCELMWGYDPDNINQLRDDIEIGIDSGATSFSLYWYNVYDKNYTLDRRSENVLVESYMLAHDLLLRNGFIELSFSRYSKPTICVSKYLGSNGPGITASPRGNILGLGWGAKTFYGGGVGFYSCDLQTYIKSNVENSYEFKLFDNDEFSLGATFIDLIFNKSVTRDSFGASTLTSGFFSYLQSKDAVTNIGNEYFTTIKGRALMDYYLHKAWHSNVGGRFDLVPRIPDVQ